MEKRVIPDMIEYREDADGATISGFIPYLSESEDLGGFVEVIEPGAFAEAVKGDVRALWNHQVGYVLGRTRAETLQLVETPGGLHWTAKPPAAMWARDALESVRRGDVTGTSFGFDVPPGGDSYERNEGRAVRRLKQINLYEVSPVTFPAYPETSVAVRDRVAALRAQEAIPVETVDVNALARARRAVMRRRRLEIERLR